MDEETLESAVEEWVAAGLIDEETGESIRAYELKNARAEPQRRTAWVVAVMGAVLIGAGIVTFLAGQWDQLSVLVRTGILAAAPVFAAVTGVMLDRRALPRAGHALWVLAAGLIGPSVFLLASMHAPDVSPHVLLFVWGIIALPMGHAFVSRLGIALALAVLLLAAGAAGEGESGFFLASLLGTVVIAASVRLRTKAPWLVELYRVIGVLPVILTLLWLNTREGNFQFVEVVWGPLLAGVFVISIVAGLAVLAWWKRDIAERGDVLAAIAPLGGASFGVVLIELEGIFPAFGVFLLGQVVLLGLLLGLVVVGITTGSRLLINLVMLGFLLQVLTLLVTVADQLPGTIALVTAGIILVLVAIGLERGRRRLLDRIPGRRDAP